jgi:hypothetical protein
VSDERFNNKYWRLVLVWFVVFWCYGVSEVGVMATIKMTVTLNYDAELVHGGDLDKEGFFDLLSNDRFQFYHEDLESIGILTVDSLVVCNE